MGLTAYHLLDSSNNEEQIEELLADPDKMFVVACLELADQGEFNEEVAWKVAAMHGGRELPAENKEEFESTEKQAVEMLDSWSDDQKRDVARKQSGKILRRIGQMMKKSKIGLFIAFIGTFSFWDLVWFPLALWTAYKIGSGRE